MRRFLSHFIDLFARYLGDLRRLRAELPNGVSEAHIEIVRQIYRSSTHEEGLTVQFKRDWIARRLRDDDKTRPFLDRIYAEARDQLVDYLDLSNLVPRLRVFQGSPPPEEALAEIQLKPNIFGIGIDLNRILARCLAWRKRRKARR